MSCSSSSTRPLAGRSNPASTRSRVVFPEPFGPRMPTKPVRRHLHRHAAEHRRPAGTRRRRQRLAATRNPAMNPRGERGEPEHFFVRPVEQVLDPSEHFELPRSASPRRRHSRLRNPRHRTARRTFHTTVRRRARGPGRRRESTPSIARAWRSHPSPTGAAAVEQRLAGVNGGGAALALVDARESRCRGRYR